MPHTDQLRLSIGIINPVIVIGEQQVTAVSYRQTFNFLQNHPSCGLQIRQQIAHQRLVEDGKRISFRQAGNSVIETRLLGVYQ